MEKETFLQATAKLQREYMFDEIQEIRVKLENLKKGLHISAFTGGFVAVFAAAGGYSLFRYLGR